MNIYCLSGIEALKEEVLIKLLPLSERNRIIKIGSAKKRTVSAAAFLLFIYAAYEEYGEANFEVTRTDKGKPYIEGNPFYFSYSHTDNSAACAVSDSPVGVDLEKVRPFNEAVAKRVCTSSELTALFSLNNEIEKENLFCKMWVQKEAYSKMTGNGFSEGFSGIDTPSNDKTDVIFNEERGEYIGVSTNSDKRSFKIIEVDSNAILGQNPKIYSSL